MIELNALRRNHPGTKGAVRGVWNENASKVAFHRTQFGVHRLPNQRVDEAQGALGAQDVRAGEHAHHRRLALV